MVQEFSFVEASAFVNYRFIELGQFYIYIIYKGVWS